MVFGMSYKPSLSKPHISYATAYVPIGIVRLVEAHLSGEEAP